jgi:hypothetical protein
VKRRLCILNLRRINIGEWSLPSVKNVIRSKEIAFFFHDFLDCLDKLNWDSGRLILAGCRDRMG